MALDLATLGKALFWYSIVFAVGLFITSTIFIVCGLPPLPLTKIAPLFSNFFQQVEHYLANGEAIPLSLRPVVFAAALANIGLYVLVSYPTLFASLLKLFGAPLPIIIGGALLGAVLEYFKYMYILSVIFGRSPI